MENNVSYKEHLEYIKTINDKFRYYKTIESMFELDQWSALPLEGGTYRQQVAAHIAMQKAELFDSVVAKQSAEYFKGVSLDEIDDYVEKGLIRSFLFRYNNQTRTPKDLMRQYSMIRAETMNKWKEAREKQDFEIFRPWLEQVFALKKQIALAIEPEKPAFDTLVNINDEGTTCEEISREFDVLKSGLTKLVGDIAKSDIKPDITIYNRTVDTVKIAEFSKRLAREIGYKEERGGFNDKVVHPFTSFMGPRDARVSTSVNNTLDMIFTCLHEAGHAMYASGGNDKVNDANMWGGIEGSFQESMARFNENIIGRSRAYWEYYYPQLQKELPEFADISLDDFYLSMNAVKPSLKRTTADEVTYSLHVILRYELERECFAGRLEVGDLSKEWNDLSEKYLGIRPSNDTEGVLQDMHWAGDYIGYFQSYALGNIYCGQMREAVLRDIPNLDDSIRVGDFTKVNGWIDENIRQYGCSFTAGEMAKRITGKSLDAAPFLKYLEEKYRAIYKI